MADISKLNSVSLADMNPIDSRLTDTKFTDKKVTKEQFREVSDMYEKHFIQQMMKQMRATVPEGTLIKKNNAEKIFQDQLDEQYAGEWNKRGGFGMADMIYQQLMQQFGEQYGFSEKGQRPAGPIELTKKSDVHPMTMPDQKNGGVTFRVHPNSETVTVDVKTPWAGTLLQKNRLEGDQTSYRIKHDNGLESVLMTQGAPSAETRHLSPGDVLQSGQSLGLANGASPMFWTVQKSVSE